MVKRDVYESSAERFGITSSREVGNVKFRTAFIEEINSMGKFTPKEIAHIVSINRQTVALALRVEASGGMFDCDDYVMYKAYFSTLIKRKVVDLAENVSDVNKDKLLDEAKKLLQSLKPDIVRPNELLKMVGKPIDLKALEDVKISLENR